jgi:hypothetical protein
MKFKFFKYGKKFFNQTYTHTNIKDETRRNLRKIKSYVEILSSKGIEKEINFDELKKFLGLTKITKDYIESNIIESKELKEKISEIISLNKSLENNLDMTKFLYYGLQREKNDFLFKTLLANSFSLIKKSDEEDSTILEYFPSISFNLKTINGKILMKSELLLDTMKSMTKELSFMEHYKGVDTDHMVNYLNTFKEMGVLISQEEFFKFHSKIALEKINDNTLTFNLAYDYFSFYINFRNDINIRDIKLRLEYKEKFKNFFINHFKEMIRTNSKILPRFDQIHFLIQNFKKDKQVQNICEYILNLKLEDDFCPIMTLIEFSNLYLNNQMMNKSILHFIAFNLMENLRSGVTIKTFESNVIPLYDLIASFSYLLDNSETLVDFYEDFKSCIFYNRYLNMVEVETNDFLNVESISNNSLIMIKNIHSKLIGYKYFDQSFDNYLERSINLNKNLLYLP